MSLGALSKPQEDVARKQKQLMRVTQVIGKGSSHLF
jgi:hypothetical protein